MTSLPRSSTSSYSESNTRLSSGCWPAQTAAASGPRQRPVEWAAKLHWCSVTTASEVGSCCRCPEEEDAEAIARSRPSRTRPLEVYHERTRRRGVNTAVYWPVRCVVKPFVLLYFRVRRLGREHIPDGAVILASNHRSFLDPFAIGICLRRPVFFVAKRELFRHPLQGWILNCMGAFPVCRGEADEESVETARQLLAGGHAVVIFPEGTRIRPGSLARPRRGVGRLALETGAPVVPIAVKGSEHARRGWRIRPVKVHVRFGAPLTFPTVERPSPVPRAGGDREDLALRGAAVGVAGWPASAAHGGRGGRGCDGHGAGRGPRARGTGGAAGLPHAGAGRAPGGRAREHGAPAGGAAGPGDRGDQRVAHRVRRSRPGGPGGPLREPARSHGARWAPGSASGRRCWWPRRAWSRRSGPCPAPTSRSAHARARWLRWPGRRSRTRPSSWVRRWWWPAATAICATSSVTCWLPVASPPRRPRT